MNLASRSGRWSAGYRKTSLYGWLVFVVAAFALGSAMGTKDLAPTDLGLGACGNAQHSLNRQSRQAGHRRDRAHPTQVADGPRGVGPFSGPRGRRLRLAHPRGSERALAARPAREVAKDGGSTLVHFEVNVDVDCSRSSFPSEPSEPCTGGPYRQEYGYPGVNSD